MNKVIDEVHQTLAKAKELEEIIENNNSTNVGIPYLQVKNHALLEYSKMEIFFMLLKLETPDNVANHPIFKELVRYRTLFERIRPLDKKMKYQIDKMLKIANSDGKGLDESLTYAPRPDQLLVPVTNQDEQSEEELDANTLHDIEVDSSQETLQNTSSNNEIYRAPRLAAMPYEEEEREQIKQMKLAEKKRKKMAKSTILSELREEFSERPTEVLASGASALDKVIAREEKEKKDYEESRFVRLVTSRKDKQRKRQREVDASRPDSLSTIDNFAGVQDLFGNEKSSNGIPRHRSVTQVQRKEVSKTGGIFAHLDVPVEKKRKGMHSAGSSSQSNPSGAQSRKKTSESSYQTTGAIKAKKKVVFTNIFQ